jgi:ketosteroid isomerase-like protein
MHEFLKKYRRPSKNKKTIFVVIALVNIFSITAFLQAQQLLTKDQQEVQQAVVKLFEALSKRDSVNLKAYCTTDISLYEYGEVWNIDTLINKAITMNTAADFKRTNTFEFISTETDKNTAWVTYRLSSAITKDSKQMAIQWLETVFLNKQKKQWKVRHLHSTLIKKN